MAKSNNIAIDFLLDKISEKELEGKLIDQDYMQRKKNNAEELRQLRAAMEQLKESDYINGKNAKGKPGRKAQPFDPDNYPYTGSLKNKMLFAINASKRFLHIREIADFIVKKEPGKDRAILIDQIGKHIYRFRNLKLIVSYKVGTSHRNMFHGLPDWMEKGMIKKGYEYNPKAIMDRGRELDTTMPIDWPDAMHRLSDK